MSVTSDDHEYEPPNQPFDVLDVQFTYEIVDSGAVEHHFHKKISVTARQPVRFYEHSFRWTGSGKIEAPEIIQSADPDHPRHRLHGPRVDEGDTVVQLIYLGRQLVKDEEEVIELRQKLMDQRNVSQPHLRFAVVNPLKRLTLRVKLPPSLAINVRSTLYDLARTKYVQPPRPEQPDEDGYYVYQIESPEEGRRYGIEWLN